MPASLLHAFGILLFAWAWLSYDHYRPWINFHSEALALLGIGLLAAGRWVVPGGHKEGLVAVPRLAWGMVILAMLPWLQWLAGISLFAGDAFITCLYLCALAVAVTLGYAYTRHATADPQGLALVFGVLWFVALASAAIGLLQWLNLQEALGMYVLQTDAGNRALGNMGQPNQLASLLLMGIVALAWTYEHRRIAAPGLLCGTGFLTLVLVQTQSRTGMLSALVVVSLLAWKSHRNAALRIRPRHAVGWLVCFLLALQALPWVQSALLMSDGRGLGLLNDNGRFFIWRQVLDGILQSPWVGYGWNQTPTAQMASALDVPSMMNYTNAHNVVLDLVAWNGIPLGLALSLVCCYWFLSRLWALEDIHPLYAMAALLPIAIHSMLEFPFAYSYFLLAAGLMAGVVEASWNNPAPIAMRRWFIGVFLGAWFALGFCAIHEYLLIEEDFRFVRFENMRVGRTPAEYKAPTNIWLLSQLGAMLIAGRQQAKRNMTADEMQNLRKTSLRFSYGSLALRYALALGLNGRPKEASRQMQIIRGIYGDDFYQSAVSALRTMQAEKYPELREVKTP